MAVRQRIVVILGVLTLAGLGLATTAILVKLDRPRQLPPLSAARSDQPAFRADFDDRTNGGLTDQAGGIVFR